MLGGDLTWLQNSPDSRDEIFLEEMRISRLAEIGICFHEDGDGILEQECLRQTTDCSHCPTPKRYL